VLWPVNRDTDHHKNNGDHNPQGDWVVFSFVFLGSRHVGLPSENDSGWIGGIVTGSSFSIAEHGSTLLTNFPNDHPGTSVLGKPFGTSNISLHPNNFYDSDRGWALSELGVLLTASPYEERPFLYSDLCVCNHR